MLQVLQGVLFVAWVWAISGSLVWILSVVIHSFRK
jgi:hypothetical protein